MDETLTVRPLTKAAFAPFGQVLETDGAETPAVPIAAAWRGD